MPPMMDAQNGTIERWIKKEGETFGPNDTICEATLSDLTIGIETGKTGILAKIVSAAGSTVSVGETIAIFVQDRDAYMSFFAEQMASEVQKEKIQDIAATEVKVDAKTILREIKHMITEG